MLYGLIFISESKYKVDNNFSGVTVHISPDYQKAVQIGAIPNPQNIQTDFVYSQGGIASIGDKFYTCERSERPNHEHPNRF